MATFTIKGEITKTNGELPSVGTVAPPFCLVTRDLKELRLEDFKGKRKIFNLFLSMDTAVCSTALQTFYNRCKTIPNIILLNISMDLPFAANRFCQDHQLESAITLSAFRSSFLEDYGVKIVSGPLKGLSARAVFALKEDNLICYRQLVSEITKQPDYEAAIDSLLSA
jgi:thioredoxin-dependent peroxiredoxin